MGTYGAPRGADSARSARDRATPPDLLPDHAHLGLADLRSYRAALQNEEGNVSYWRRVVQARLDVVRSGLATAAHGGTKALDAGQLGDVLSSGRVDAGRTALLQIVAREDIPPLPDLAELWQRLVPEGDEAGRLRLEQDLLAAESRLSQYRGALLTRLDEATGELVARYRTQPQLCLSALPLPPARPGRPALAARSVAAVRANPSRPGLERSPHTRALGPGASPQSDMSTP